MKKSRSRYIQLDATSEVSLRFPMAAFNIIPTEPGSDIRGLRIKGLASSGAKNRKGFRIRPSAWGPIVKRLNDKGRMPVMLFNHDDGIPVGRWTKLTVTDSGLEAEGVVVDQKYADLCESGVIRELSVRFLPLKAERNEDGVPEVVGIGDLPEISLVSVPADEDAQINTLALSALIVDEKPKAGGATMLNIILKMLGLAEDAGEGTIIQTLSAKLKQASLALKILGALKIDAEEDESSVLLQIAKIRAPENFVEKTVHEVVLKERDALKTEALLAPYKESIPEDMLSIAKDFALTDQVKFLALMDGLKEVLPKVPGGKITGAGGGLPPKKGGDKVTLSAEDLEVMEQMGHFDKAEDLEANATIKPNEALSLIWKEQGGRPMRFKETKLDKAAIAQRAAFESR